MSQSWQAAGHPLPLQKMVLGMAAKLEAAVDAQLAAAEDEMDDIEVRSDRPLIRDV